jgi:hypothetical protein
VSGDIVERLRRLGSIDCPYGCDEVGNPAADEIERLRAAGDALADNLRRHQMACGVNDASAAVAAWEEARHEQ